MANGKYELTVEKYMCSRDKVLEALHCLLEEWYYQVHSNHCIPLPDVRNQLEAAIYYLNNDGVIREQLELQLGIQPKIKWKDNDIKLSFIKKE